MGRPVAAVLVALCLIALTTRAAAYGEHGLRRGLEQAMRGRFLADATAGGGATVPISWSPSEFLYVANFTIGKPPQAVSAVIDLTGELIWTQCKQCSSCFKQELPLFDPTKSSTYRPEPCGTDLCRSIPTRNCSSNVCIYEAPTKAGDTFGIVGTDTVAIGTAKATLAFGCVLATVRGLETIGGPSGIVGLGRTPWSLVHQMNATAFSYCLAPHVTGKDSKLFLGASAKLSGGGGGNGTSTPLVRASAGSGSDDDGSDPFYMVQLEGIKAGGVNIKAASTGGSTVYVNTVFPFSLLVDGAYQALKKAVAAAVGVSPMAKPPKPFDLCFQKSAGGSSAAPDLVFTFQGGAALTLPPPNYLLAVGNDTACLSILSSKRLNLTDGVSILGSLQQENTHFVFDLAAETLSFEHADCTSLSS
ncbi:aspartic proteinase nepenthesin-1-like [Oryza brachyantha]|uniref:Peptidase A1 domain-containing protein n=1 Tax=Oryza brachyantha TaxID=4533 RepID=J3N4H4_ORYBR|nr:aspartic proteinase nepenthesin-1-like [Oryza brachyantha]